MAKNRDDHRENRLEYTEVDVRFRNKIEDLQAKQKISFRHYWHFDFFRIHTIFPRFLEDLCPPPLLNFLARSLAKFRHWNV
ncbi:hypothetical protein ACTXT7_003251 [Hymenolepis weldensis]